MQRVEDQDGCDRNGEPRDEQMSMLHAAIVAAEGLRQVGALHKLAQLRRDVAVPALAGDVQQSVNRGTQCAQQLAAFERAHDCAVEAREYAGRQVVKAAAEARGALVPDAREAEGVVAKTRDPVLRELGTSVHARS